MRWNMRIARTEKGLSCKQAGEAVGVTQNMIERYERSEAEPKASILLKLSELYGQSPEYLMVEGKEVV